MADILEGDQWLMEGVEHGSEPPDALESSGGYTAFALRFLKDVGRTVFLSIGVGSIGNALSGLYHIH